LLYLEKLDNSFRETVNKDAINLAELINICANRFRQLRPEISWEIDNFNLLVSGPKEQWTVLLDNLFDNQLRYAKKRITIVLRPGQNSQKSILRIWNDGPPIDPEIKEEIFTAYQTGADGNFGLGLFIAKKIIEKQQGRIWVENEEGGPAFYLEIHFIEDPQVK
jgi:two-component system sensor histidine kinase CssS